MPLSDQDKRSESEQAQDQQKLEQAIKQIFYVTPESTVTSLVQKLGVVKYSRDIHIVLNRLESSGLIKQEPLSGGKWVSLIYAVKGSTKTDLSDPRIPQNILFVDWMNVVPQLLQLYKLKINTMLIGPKGIGKTESIRKLAELLQQPLEYENFSLRTREHHFIGRLDSRADGTIGFKPGSLLKSMQDGCIWYGDEINVAEADALIRLDEATDSRRQLTIEGETIHAQDSWWCVSSINPLSHAGTKELPPQLLSRFPARLYFSYPDLDTELEIVRAHCKRLKGAVISELKKVIEAIQHIRTLDLPYVPSIRETVAIGKLVESEVKLKDAITWCILNVYYQYDESTVAKVKELLVSRGIPT